MAKRAGSRTSGRTTQSRNLQELDVPKDQLDTNSNGYSRRGFLARIGIGVVAIAAASLPFANFLGGGAKASGDPFPGKGSIFHPAQDPRQDPRRNKTT